MLYTLYNFIRTHSTTDLEFKPYDDNEDLLPSSDEINESSVTEESEIYGRGKEMEDER